MTGIIVDIDDTLVDTSKRQRMVWHSMLNLDIPLETIERLDPRQILNLFAFGDRQIWQRYWQILLCWDDPGLAALELDEPAPFAPQVLQRWNEEHKIIYLTGRSDNMRKATLNELEKFDFPLSCCDLVMLRRKDWKNYFASKTSPRKLRSDLFSSIAKRYNILRVVDDFPLYFPVYSHFKVPDRVGLLRPKRFPPHDYINQGATRVTTWKELRNEMQ